MHQACLTECRLLCCLCGLVGVLGLLCCRLHQACLTVCRLLCCLCGWARALACACTVFVCQTDRLSCLRAAHWHPMTCYTPCPSALAFQVKAQHDINRCYISLRLHTCIALACQKLHMIATSRAGGAHAHVYSRRAGFCGTAITAAGQRATSSTKACQYDDKKDSCSQYADTTPGCSAGTLEHPGSG